jgi:hypothetical protein
MSDFLPGLQLECYAHFHITHATCLDYFILPNFVSLHVQSYVRLEICTSDSVFISLPYVSRLSRTNEGASTSHNLTDLHGLLQWYVSLFYFQNI